MKQLTKELFAEHIKRKSYCILHPSRRIAFRIEGENLYAKGAGNKEREISWNDEDYFDALFFTTIISRNEYDKY